MQIWEEQLPDKTRHEKLRKLEKFGQMRWSSRARALKKLFGSYSDHTKELFSDVLVTLKHVREWTDFRPKVRFEGKSLSDKLSNFETILVAFVYIRHHNPSLRLFADIWIGRFASMENDKQQGRI